MASLYSTSQNARKVLLVIVAIVIVILAFDTISSFQNSESTNLQKARRFYMASDNFFGDIKSPEIPSIPIAEESKPVFSLRQPVFGKFPDVAYVYFVEKSGEKLETFENALDKASLIGFEKTLLEENGREMIWTIQDGTKVLNFNRDTFKWDLNTNYTSNIEAIRKKTVSNQSTTYSRNVTALLKKFVLNSASYNFGFRDAVTTVTLANIGPSGLFYEVKSANEAQYARVDVFRQLPFADLKPQDQQPELLKNEIRPTAVSGVVYREDPRLGIFSAIVSNNFTNYEKDLFDIDFIDFNYTGQTGKYLIISPDDAWTKIQNGEASLVSIKTLETDQFSKFPLLNVRKFEADPVKTKLGYFEPRVWNGYVTPIYIFEGTATLDTGRLASFTYYVNALRESVPTK